MKESVQSPILRISLPKPPIGDLQRSQLPKYNRSGFLGRICVESRTYSEKKKIAFFFNLEMAGIYKFFGSAIKGPVFPSAPFRKSSAKSHFLVRRGSRSYKSRSMLFVARRLQYEIISKGTTETTDKV